MSFNLKLVAEHHSSESVSEEPLEKRNEEWKKGKETSDVSEGKILGKQTWVSPFSVRIYVENTHPDLPKHHTSQLCLPRSPGIYPTRVTQHRRGWLAQFGGDWVGRFAAVFQNGGKLLWAPYLALGLMFDLPFCTVIILYRHQYILSSTNHQSDV